MREHTNFNGVTLLFIPLLCYGVPESIASDRIQIAFPVHSDCPWCSRYFHGHKETISKIINFVSFSANNGTDSWQVSVRFEGLAQSRISSKLYRKQHIFTLIFFKLSEIIGWMEGGMGLLLAKLKQRTYGIFLGCGQVYKDYWANSKPWPNSRND